MTLPVPILAEQDGILAGLLKSLREVVQEFDLNWPSFIAQVVGFSLVAYVLWRFAFKPVLATLDERQKKIESGLQYADEMKAKLAAAHQEAQAQLKEAQAKAREIVAEAQKAAKEFAEKQQQDAIEKAGALVHKAQEAILLEKKKMLAEARTELARLVVVTTQRVLAKELSELERGRFNEAAARELTQA
jgi:F-type H+-transporting ATPase subunit b